MKLSTVQISSNFETRNEAAQKTRVIVLLTEYYHFTKSGKCTAQIVKELLSLKEGLGNSGSDMRWPADYT